MALRELFHKVAKGVEEYANLIVEHIVQLGGMAERTVQAVFARRVLAFDCGWERPNRCAIDDAGRIWETCTLHN